MNSTTIPPAATQPEDHGRTPMNMPTPVTFIELLAARTGVMLRSVVPAATPQRVDQASLSSADQQRFIDAVDTLNLPDQTGISAFGRLVAVHSDMGHRMHAMGGADPATDPGQQRFLSWHRVYLYEFEQLLQTVHPDITIPYWDWSSPAEQAVPGWLVNVRPVVNVPRPGPGRITVTRFPGTMGFTLTDVIGGAVDASIASLATVENATDFTSFASGLESIHDLVHVWVGGRRGTMGRLDRAPADPLFWMHHANIDRLWFQWQKSPQGQGQRPNLQGGDMIMDPWAFTDSDTEDLATFKYTYP
ncbi:tyrosinase family protein [Arthrobacter sp. TE12232]